MVSLFGFWFDDCQSKETGGSQTSIPPLFGYEGIHKCKNEILKLNDQNILKYSINEIAWNAMRLGGWTLNDCVMHENAGTSGELWTKWLRYVWKRNFDLIVNSPLGQLVYAPYLSETMWNCYMMESLKPGILVLFEVALSKKYTVTPLVNTDEGTLNK